MKKSGFLIIPIFLLLIQALPVLQAQKLDVQVSFSVPNNGFRHKYRLNITEYERAALDTLIKGLNEYIAYANFTKLPQRQKLKIELIAVEKAGSSNSNYLMKFTYDAGDGTLERTHDWPYIDFDGLVKLNKNYIMALEHLGSEWSAYLKGNYNAGLTKNLFTNLYLPIPSSEHYTPTYKAVFPLTKDALKLNTALSLFTVAIEFNDAPSNFTPQNGIVYNEDFKESKTVGTVNLKGCLCVQLAPWGPNRTPRSGRVYFKEYERMNNDDLD